MSPRASAKSQAAALRARCAFPIPFGPVNNHAWWGRCFWKASTNSAQINSLLKTASKNELKGILGYEERPLVSSDFVNDPRSCIIDSLSTMVVNETQVKVYAWYDNEWGYANRLVDIVGMVAKNI